MVGLTPSQTVGPFFHDGLLRDRALDVVAHPGTSGERIVIEGRVLDGDGEAVDNGLVEVWQADARGHYPRATAARAPGAGARGREDPGVEETFLGFGRCGTDATGSFRFETVKPGAVELPEGGRQAPHLLVFVFATGLLDQLVTRLYFPGEPGNDDDPVLRQVPEERRSTLVAKRGDGDEVARREDGDGVVRYRFDIHLQGPDETVFFAF